MNVSHCVVSAILAIVLSGALAHSQSVSRSGSEPVRLGVSNMQLIHCTPGPADSPGWNAPCFRFLVNVLDDQGDSASIPSGFAAKLVQTRPEAKEWNVLLNRDTRGQSAALRKRYVLILFDVSGSMNELTTENTTKFDAARKAAENALNIFTSGTDYVAIVPFDSHHVAERIRGAVFGENIQSARRQLAALPPPSTGNTALYSAVVQGIALLGEKDRDSEKVLMVMTDGMNDVDHPGDDGGLLGNIQPALDSKQNSQITVFTVGFGKAGAIDETAMRRLASDPKNFFLAANTQTLLKTLQRVVEQIVNSFQVTATVMDAQAFETLGRRTLKLRIETGGKVLESDEREFIPPAFGSPITDLSADEDEAKAYNAYVAPPPNNRPIWQILTFVFYALAITVLWVLLPRFVWPADSQSAVDDVTPL